MSLADLTTVAICTRERPKMLATALAALREVTPDGVQILVVDSASTTSDTREAALAAGVDYVRTDVKGLSIARNLALATSRRPFIVYTDDDCEATDGWLDPLLGHLADPAVGAVTGTMLDHTLVGERALRPLRRHTTTVHGLDAGHGALMGFRRELLVALGGFDPVLGAGRAWAGAEDLDIFCRLLDAGWQIVFDPTAVVHHVHTREDSAYAELHRGYGRGLGALAAKWLRIRTGVGLRLSAVVLKRTLVRWIGHLRAPRRRSADLALMSGFVQGLGEGLRAPLSSHVYGDPHPPEPVTLSEPSSGGPFADTEENDGTRARP